MLLAVDPDLHRHVRAVLAAGVQVLLGQGLDAVGRVARTVSVGRVPAVVEQIFHQPGGPLILRIRPGQQLEVGGVGLSLAAVTRSTRAYPPAGAGTPQKGSVAPSAIRIITRLGWGEVARAERLLRVETPASSLSKPIQGRFGLTGEAGRRRAFSQSLQEALGRGAADLLQQAYCPRDAQTLGVTRLVPLGR